MNEEPTKIPRSGSQYRGRTEKYGTDKVLDDALGKGEKVVAILKKILAFSGTGGTGSVLGQALGEVLGMPDVKWWMTGGAAIGVHLAVVLADFATKALRRINTVAARAEAIGAKVEHALDQLGAIVKRMDAGQAVHEALGKRVTMLEAFEAARQEEADRERLRTEAAGLGVALTADMTVEEMRALVKRAKSHGAMRAHPHKSHTDETAVPPPTVDFDALEPEGP